jgi:REP-associated tyrosine transposase
MAGTKSPNTLSPLARFTGLFILGLSLGNLRMADNCYSEINLHLTWHTKLSRALLTPDIEAMAFGCLRQKAAAVGDVYLHEIGGTETHVHLALSIEPTVLISELVGVLKGYSAHEVNRRNGMGRTVLQWQAGYGVVSFGTRDLPWVVEYVRNQKEHHAAGRTFERLERMNRFDDRGAAAEAEETEAP